jgi:hypothetical protein
MAWTANDPVSTPGKGTVYVAAFFLAVTAIVGVGLGFRASMRDASRSGAQGSVDDNLGVDQAQPARPIVEIPNQVAPPPETNAAATNGLAAATNTVVKKPDEADATNDIAVRTAAVQAAQNNPAKPPADIDSLLTSQSERPQAPAKPSTDDQPPAASTPPAKTDVPF